MADILFVRTGQFRARLAEVLAHARTDRVVIVHSGHEPRALVQREQRERLRLRQLDRAAIDTKPRKYIFEAVRGKLFQLVDEVDDGTRPIVLRKAGSEWNELTAEHEPPGSSARRHHEGNRERRIQERRQWYQEGRDKERKERAEEFAAQVAAALGEPVKPHDLLADLSPREKQVALLVLQKSSYDAIAAELGRTRQTAIVTRHHLFKKLRISARSGFEGLRAALLTARIQET